MANVKKHVVTSTEPPFERPSIKTIPEYLLEKAEQHSKNGKIYYAVKN